MSTLMLEAKRKLIRKYGIKTLKRINYLDIFNDTDEFYKRYIYYDYCQFDDADKVRKIKVAYVTICKEIGEILLEEYVTNLKK